MSSVSFFALPTKQLKSKLRPWIIAITLCVFVALVLVPAPEGLTDAGMNALAIFVLCLIFWVTNAIPLMITSMMAIILLPLLGVLDAKVAYGLFGNQAVFFILGAFILASAVMQSGLSNRIALKILHWFRHSHITLLLGVLLLPAGLSFVMSEHAVAAMMFPIVLEIARVLKLKEGSRYGLALILAMTWGSIIGGIGTFLGGARAVLAVGILEETTGQTISFLQWMFAALPTVIIMLGVAFLILWWMARHETYSVKDVAAHVQKESAALGKLTRREISIGTLMIVTILLWVFAGHSLGLANIALGAVVVAFIFKLLSWKQVENDVNWGIILMYGGAIALGFALDQSGAAAWLTEYILGNWVASAWGLVLLLSILAKVLTEGMSNTAVIALMMPIALALATLFNVDVVVATLALAIPSGLAFMLPISTPATAIAVSSKFVTTGDTLRTGAVLNIVSILVFALVALYYWPMIGLHI